MFKMMPFISMRNEQLMFHRNWMMGPPHGFNGTASSALPAALARVLAGQ
jgi:hypothetical protein